MSTKVTQIEEWIKLAFIEVVKDYRNGKIGLEEDFRASFYHHLRPHIDQDISLLALLSHNLSFISETVKPDISIFRKNDYLVAVEMKFISFNKEEGNRDVMRLKRFKDYFSKGYFIHIDKSDKRYGRRNSPWHNNFYRELYYVIDQEMIYFYDMSRGGSLVTEYYDFQKHDE